MNDPLSPLTVPPPRYLLESDSSDEEGQGTYSYLASHRNQSVETPRVTLEWTSERPDALDAVILGAGQLGRYLKRRYALVSRPEDLVVKLSGKKVGHGWKVEKGLVIAIADELDQPTASVWECAKSLLRVQAKSWIIVSSYLPSMYIPGPSEVLEPSVIPIRYVHITGASPTPASTSMKRLDPPNFIIGLAAAMATAAAHPSHTASTSSMTVISLPLPLSSIPYRVLQNSISVLSPSLGSSLAPQPKSSASQWSESDDEPFSGPGMGGKRNIGVERPALREDVAGMYM